MLAVSQQALSAVGHWTLSFVLCSRQYLLSQGGRCLLRHTADIVCCGIQQTLSAVPHCRQCLLCHTVDSVCCVTQQALSALLYSRQCLACHSANIVCGVTHRQIVWQAHSQTNCLSVCPCWQWCRLEFVCFRSLTYIYIYIYIYICIYTFTT